LELAKNQKGYAVEFDLDGLLRMDPLGRAEAYTKLIGCAVYAPNEARLKENLPGIEGGDVTYLQQQNYSLPALARRDEQPAPSSTTPSTPNTPNPNPTPSEPSKGRIFEGEFTEDSVEEIRELFLREAA
jgi:hypothetical protein